MHVILAATPYAGWEAVKPLLTHLGLNPPEDSAVSRWQAALFPAVPSAEHPASDTSSLSGPREQSTPYAELLASCDAPGLIDMTAHVDRLEPWLEVADDTWLMLFHCRPEIAVNRAIAAGELPTAAADGWLSVSERLLGVVRRHRSRTLVVDVEAAVFAPNLFLGAVKQHLGRAVPPWKEALQTPEQPGDDFQRLVAAQCVAQRSEVRPLLGELEASSLAIAEPTRLPAPDCDRAWSAAQNSEEQHRREIEALIKARDERERMLHSNVNAQRADDKVEKELADVKEENELLLAQLHQVQEELERYYLQTQDLKRTTSLQGKELQLTTSDRGAQAKLERMEKTLSWRITAPLRWGFRPFKRGLSRRKG